MIIYMRIITLTNSIYKIIRTSKVQRIEWSIYFPIYFIRFQTPIFKSVQLCKKKMYILITRLNKIILQHNRIIKCIYVM